MKINKFCFGHGEFEMTVLLAHLHSQDTVGYNGITTYAHSTLCGLLFMKSKILVITLYISYVVFVINYLLLDFTYLFL